MAVEMVVVVAAAGCVCGGDGNLNDDVLVVVVVYQVNTTWYHQTGLCADAHRVTLKAIPGRFLNEKQQRSSE